MRFYGFGNYYLSSLQQGLQSAHCVGDLFAKHYKNKKKLKKVYDWAQNHKTMVLLNGGNSKQLQDLFDELKSIKGMKLPFVKFHEDEQSLGGALTYVGMVVPEKIYNLAAQMRQGDVEGLKENWKTEVARILNRYRLAS